MGSHTPLGPVTELPKSAVAAKTATATVRTVALAFGTRPSAHHRCLVLFEKSEGVPGLVQGPSSPDCEIDAPADPAVDSSL